MKVSLIYSTPNYHKLVERAARRCYDSFHKCNLDSHRFIRGIMKKGHLSVAGHGNIVLAVNTLDKNGYFDILDSLVTFKEINNYIRWSRDDNSNWDIVISMNILTYLDVFTGLHENPHSFDHFNRAKEGDLFKAITEAILDVPDLRWFVDHEYELEGSVNPYLTDATDLLLPTVLSSDYASLKNKGLTDYELDIHSTVTVEIVSDRAMSLQDARHSDMMGRSEISQRYVTMSNFQYRTPMGINSNEVFDVELDVDADGKSTATRAMTYDDMMNTIKAFYNSIFNHYKNKKIPELRAKEMARSVLPNATYTTYIDTRPLRQWKHFFKLRDDVHAQNEKQQDAKALLKAFRDVGIPV
jgi:thymidylate synthase ThyX